jgi:hypothetical protein
MDNHDSSNRRGLWPAIPPTEKELQQDLARQLWKDAGIVLVLVLGLAVIAGLICWRVNGGRFS